jgi:hypothetical protein
MAENRLKYIKGDVTMFSGKKPIINTRIACYVGIFLLLIVVCMVILYYRNAPSVEFGPDTYGYLGAVQQLQTTGNPVNYFRLPGYPLFLLGVYILTHQGDLMAASMLQGFLFLCSVVEIALLAFLITRRTWIAFFIGIFMGTNIFLLYSAKIIMTEGLALWLLITVMLSAIAFLKTPRIRYFWIGAVSLLLLLFTRPEWVFFPAILFPILILFTWKKLPVRAVLLPVISSLVVIYLLVGGYIYANARINHIASLSYVTNMNLIGKVLQYRMQDESPYNSYLSHTYDSYLKQGIDSPFQITSRVQGLGDNYAQTSADWAKGIILHHPVEFLVKSVPYLFTTLYSYAPSSIPHIQGKYAGIFNLLLQIHIHLALMNILFPLCALIWLVLCCSRKTRHVFGVQAMGLLSLTIIYAMLITTLGSYADGEYARIHVVFDPLLSLVILGSLGLGIYQLQSFLRNRAPRLGFHIKSV